MSLLLLDRSTGNEALCRLTLGGQARSADVAAPAIPLRAPAAGEQYRFHFDMTRCIGCRCCEVACAEQNGNPVGIDWRRVGEIEGGAYPYTERFYLSMGCNQCLTPSCLTGCPVDAYSKSPSTGVVLHDPDMCIGCGYCTWNCPYGVPQYNPERGVVGKCDMCHNRLSDGLAPACVDACPEEAIRIELVNIAEWRADHAAGHAPGMPAVDHTVSTTRITLPERLTPGMERADYYRVEPEAPHWPLVFLLVLTQLAAGAFLYLALSPRTHIATVAALLVAMLPLGASTLHLGRPAYAWRALKMWRRSWLSREVALFALFTGAAAVSVILPAALPIAAALGFAGVTASAFLYLVPARPSWNSRHTVADFYLTALLLGPLFLAALGTPIPVWATAGAGIAQLLNHIVRLVSLAASDEFELRSTLRLLTGRLRTVLLARFVLLVAGGIVAPLAGYAAAGFALAVLGEIVSRYLFFVSVVPHNIAATFFGRRAA